MATKDPSYFILPTRFAIDGAVTVWNVYSQTWEQYYPGGVRPSDALLASLPREERDAVCELLVEVVHERTFEEWLEAAGRADSASEYDLRGAWRAGEDPAEYRH